MKTVCLFSVAMFCAASAYAANTVTKETLKIDRDSRTYYLFVPDSVGSEPAPLIIALHGSGRDGRPLVDPFRDLASKERFIVVGPDATDKRGWQVPADGPAFLYFLIEAVKSRHAIDGRRVYLFGHSAGASFALAMGLMESEYFAAAAVHGTALQREGRDQLLSAAPRKLPIIMLHGANDTVVPMATGRDARNALQAAGFTVDFRELLGFEHNSLYTHGDAVPRLAWEFFKQQVLGEEPRFQIYNYQK